MRPPRCAHLHRSVACQWFLMAFSGRPGSSLASAAQRVPSMRCPSTRMRSSSAVHSPRRMSGFRWFSQRSRHCLPRRPFILLAMKLHFRWPNSSTNLRSWLSSCSVHCCVLPLNPRWDPPGVPTFESSSSSSSSSSSPGLSRAAFAPAAAAFAAAFSAAFVAFAAAAAAAAPWEASCPSCRGPRPSCRGPCPSGPPSRQPFFVRCVTGKVRKGDRRERRTGKGQPRGRKSSGFGPELKQDAEKRPEPRVRRVAARPEVWRYSAEARRRGSDHARSRGGRRRARGSRPTITLGRDSGVRVVRPFPARGSRERACDARETPARDARARTAPRTISSLATASTRGDETRGRGERGGRGRARREAAQRAAFAARPSRRYPKPQLDARGPRSGPDFHHAHPRSRDLARKERSACPTGKTLAWTLRIQLPGAGGIWGDARRFPRVPRRARTTS